MINIKALHILHRNARHLHVTAVRPGGQKIVVRVTSVSATVSGVRMDNGAFTGGISPEWITDVTAI